MALFRIPDALAQMRRQLAALTEPTPLTGFLPGLLEGTPDRDLVARSAVSSTFVAVLELARLAELDLSEGTAFKQVRRFMTALRLVDAVQPHTRHA